MASSAITIPSLQINGLYVSIVPNSLSIRRGFGTTTVDAESIGSTVTTVFKKDQTKAVGYVTFMIEPTDDNISQMQVIQDNNPNNVVQITQNNFSRTMPAAAITNDFDENLGADKNITIEMSGDQIV